MFLLLLKHKRTK